MNKYTLRFNNHQLENAYLYQQNGRVLKSFKLSQLCFYVCLLIFLVRFLVSDAEIGLIYQNLVMQLLAIFCYTLGVYVQQLIPYISYVENVLICMIQLHYCTDMDPKDSSVPYQNNQESFIAGFIYTILQLSFITSPDFPQNLVTIISICIIKLTMSMIKNFSMFGSIVPFGGVVLTQYIYFQQIESRENFLRQYQNKGKDFLFHEGFTESFMQCSVNTEECRINLVTKNKAFENQFNVTCNSQLTQFLRGLLVRSNDHKLDRRSEYVTLESWLWEKTGFIQEQDQSSGFFSYQGILLGTILQSKDKFQISIIISQLEGIEFSIFIRPQKEISILDQREKDRVRYLIKWIKRINKQNFSIIQRMKRIRKIISKDPSCKNAIILSQEIKSQQLKLCSRIVEFQIQSPLRLQLQGIQYSYILNLVYRTSKNFIPNFKLLYDGLQKTIFCSQISVLLHTHFRILRYLKWIKESQATLTIQMQLVEDYPMRLKMWYLLDVINLQRRLIQKRRISLEQRLKQSVYLIGLDSLVEFKSQGMNLNMIKELRISVVYCDMS